MGLLSEMAAGSEQRLVEARAVISDAKLRMRCAALPPLPRLQLSAEGFDLIAELKLRSPALGDLSARTMDPVARLRGYAEAGAAICSVLTEPSRFDGDLSHLRQAATTLAPYGVPAMRKDFLVDPYQVLEARVNGAGGVLLIVRMVGRERLVAMLDAAAEQGLIVLLEAFDAHDLEIAAELAAARQGRDEQVLMGLNCRDLQTLQIDFARFEQLRDRLPQRVARGGRERSHHGRRCCARGAPRLSVGTRRHHADAA